MWFPFVRSLLRRRLGLRGVILFAIFFVAPTMTLVVSVANEITASRQAILLVDDRGRSVLDAMDRRVAERRRSLETFAELLAGDAGMDALVTRRDVVGLAQRLLPRQIRLRIDHVDVYGADGRRVLHLGEDETGHDHDPAAQALHARMLRAAVAGTMSSRATVTSSGLLVVAASPVTAPNGIAGAVIVASRLQGGDLKEAASRNAVEVALLSRGRLASSTFADPNLAEPLRRLAQGLDRVDEVNRSLAKHDYRASVRSVGDEEAVAALVPTQDLRLAFEERIRVRALGLLVVILILIALARWFLRSVASPVERMAAVARHMADGNFHERVPGSSIRELGDLATAFNDMAQHVESQVAALSHQAFYDELTGLANRALFLERLDHALARTARTQASIAVMLLDLDNFKVINDSLGHQSGDQLLVLVADRLREVIRQADTVARLGGDEFAVLLEDGTDKDVATEIAGRVIEQLQEAFTLQARQVFVHATIGIALRDGRHDTASDLLRNADLALYRAKAHGRARYEVYEPSMHIAVLKRLETEAQLRRAVERNEFSLRYQPVVEIDTGRVRGFEALVRWEHPAQGVISPANFIPVAEETGLILPIGRWVLQQACRQARSWPAAASDEPAMMLSVNISARQFQHSQLVQTIARVVEEAALDPQRLVLEITESVFLQDAVLAHDQVRRLKDLGVRLAIDDFGTGYSSLSYLRRFPIDLLKIDKSFIQSLSLAAATRTEPASLAYAIVKLAQTLKIPCVAEGIERADQLHRLRTWGCALGQGNYFAAPLAADRVGQLLREVGKGQTIRAAMASA